MRLATFSLAFTAATLLTTPAVSQDKATPGDRAEESTRRIKELQKQRIATLKQAVEVGFKLAQSGRIEVGEVLEDRMNLLKAEAEATPKASDRVPLYTKAIDSLRECEELAKARWEAGRGSEYALLKVRAKRLEVEVLLERAKNATEGK